MRPQHLNPRGQYMEERSQYDNTASQAVLLFSEQEEDANQEQTWKDEEYPS